MGRWKAACLNFLEHNEFRRYLFSVLGYCLKAEDSEESPVCILARLTVMAGATTVTHPPLHPTPPGRQLPMEFYFYDHLHYKGHAQHLNETSDTESIPHYHVTDHVFP